ncbi:hypothetical protein PoB_000193400 [Plakobranchus ocellatus]|uniref:Uncharacterized protein n=1 Tax=Plakobranchus ocellatus TaxID=259542 RepID=A0AAV3Y0B2_9GAST|nr:hypothetical protein PoB_000193400 [Plakobranchus ocellatus]
MSREWVVSAAGRKLEWEIPTMGKLAFTQNRFKIGTNESANIRKREIYPASSLYSLHRMYHVMTHARFDPKSQPQTGCANKPVASFITPLNGHNEAEVQMKARHTQFDILSDASSRKLNWILTLFWWPAQL